ncbi:cytochrome c oxidase assembly protein [soil metagenome]
MSELAPVVAVAVGAWAYGRGLRRLWARAGTGRVVSRARAAAFAAGMVSLVAVLSGPLPGAAHRLLWAHMVQHVVLMAVSAPLLVLGAPLPTLLWALPEGARRRASTWVRRLNRSHARSGWYAWAAAAVVAHAVAVWAWHVPGAFEAALHHEVFHVAEHASFFGTAVVLWWVVLGDLSPSVHGAGVVAVFLTALQGGTLGAFMTLASHPWYPAYTDRAGSTLTALEDQQVAGVIMWAPAGLAYLLAGIAVFAVWVGRSEQANPGVSTRNGPGAAMRH